MLAICNIYLLCISICVCESCAVCICMYSCSKHDMCIYMLLFCLFYLFMLCLIIDLYLSVVYPLIEEDQSKWHCSGTQ